ncbi:MAG TPA: VWA domain-containing protein [Roseiflexaceae bacterium]|nr:VWA domain-containing protein [Roseiflexaceae bacterium]
MSRTIRLATLGLVAALLLACGGLGGLGSGDPSTPPANAIRISIAYSPEKETWLNDRIAAFNASRTQVDGRPIFVEGMNKSSGAARTEIRNGQLDVTIWTPSASTWLEVLKYEGGNPNVAVSNKPLVLTPVVIAMWRPMAEALGWPNQPIGWRDMLDLINDPQGWGRYGRPEWGRFSWGHTDPEISTSALSTLLAEFYAAAGKQRDLPVADIETPASQQFTRALGKGIRHYGYNTLIFSENMRKFGMSYISAFPMEEITLIDFNKNTNPPTPLVAIYPREGTFWHDNPFIIMSSASTEERQAAEQFYNYLLSTESQQLAMQFGFRPANIEVPIADPISPAFGVQPQGVQSVLPVPPAEVLVAAKNTWALNRKRADIVLVIDVSGSMEGEKLDTARAGIATFLSRILPEDRVGIVAFDTRAELLVAPAPLTESRIALDDAIFNLSATGKTALYDALIVAKQTLDDLPPAESGDRIKAIVLLSDGIDNASSASFDELQNAFDESGISIFPVAYGSDADTAVLERIAEFSRTLLVKGDTGDIALIFENLSRYF